MIDDSGPPRSLFPDDGLRLGMCVYRPDTPFFLVGWITEMAGEYVVIVSQGIARYERRAGLAPFPMAHTRTYAGERQR